MHNQIWLDKEEAQCAMSTFNDTKNKLLQDWFSSLEKHALVLKDNKKMRGEQLFGDKMK